MRQYLIVSLIGLVVLAIFAGCAELRETISDISEIIKDYASATPTPTTTPTVVATMVPTETPVPVITPTGIPTITPTPSTFCIGDELLCIDDFSRVNIAYPYAMDGTVSQDGTFLPNAQGGFVIYNVPLNLSQRVTITLRIRGTIPNASLSADTGGKVSLLSWDTDAGDYLLSFQRMYAEYRGGGRFRIMHGTAQKEALLITSSDLAGEYSMLDWRDNDTEHLFIVTLEDSAVRLSIDNEYTSGICYAQSTLTGTYSVNLVIGNRPLPKMPLGQAALTHFVALKIE